MGIWEIVPLQKNFWLNVKIKIVENTFKKKNMVIWKNGFKK